MSDAKPDANELTGEKQSHFDMVENNSVQLESAEQLHRCPCCGYKTLSVRGWFEICEVCFWEDDGQDDHDADVVRGGPNYELSLTQGRANYKAFGASRKQDLEHVRPPLPEEM